jgi:hypothetical protein
MKTSFHVIFFLSATCALFLQAQTINYQSITNLANHGKKYKSDDFMLKVWPDVSTNTTEFFYPNSIFFKKVFLSISLSNTVLVVGSTNALHCRLVNQSTNKIAYWTGTFACLTGQTTNNYQLLPDLNPSRAKSGIGFPSLAVGKVSEWDLPFVIDQNVPPVSRTPRGASVRPPAP